MASVVRAIGLLVFGFILSSCGGSGTTTASILPRVSVRWPDLTRTFNAPKIAKSAVISIFPNRAGATETRWAIDRPSSTAEATLTYIGSPVAAAGPATITVYFQTATGGFGDNVGSATISGRIADDGTLLDSIGLPLQDISYTGTVTSLSPSIPEILTVRGTRTLSVAGRTSYGGFVALDQTLIAPRLASQVISGSAAVSVSGRTLTGLSEGDASIEVSLDGMTGTLPLRVAPEVIAPRRIGVVANGLSIDQSGANLWATFGAANVHANSIGKINVTTGGVSNLIVVGSEPDAIQVSPDGSRAYVGIRGSHGLRRVELGTAQLGPIIDITDSRSQIFEGFVTSISVNPSTSSEIAVTCQASSTGTNWGPIIIKDDVRLSDYISGFYSDYARCAYSSGTSLVGANGNSSDFSVSKGQVSSTGVVHLMKRANVISSYGVSHVDVDGTTGYTSNGAVFDVDSLSRIAQIEYPVAVLNTGQRPIDVALDPAKAVVWAAFSDYGGSANITIRSVKTDTWGFSSAFSLAGIEGDFKRMYRFGANSLVLHTTKAIYVVDSLPTP